MHLPQTPYVATISEPQRQRMLGRMTASFNKACNSISINMDDTKKRCFRDADKILRETFVANKVTFDVSKSLPNIIRTYVMPIATRTVAAYFIFTDLSENKTARAFQYIGGITFIAYTVFEIVHAIYSLYKLTHSPMYSEQQIRLSALFLALRCGTAAITGNSIAQQFIDYTDEHYDTEKTLSQNAQIAQQKGAIK